MTIATTASSITLNGDGSNTVWSYSFLIPAASNVTVTTVVNGVSTVIDPSLYTITTGNPDGGTVTYPLSGSPLVNGSTITIARNLPLTQTTELTSQGNFDPAVVEDALDYITMLVQDLNTEVSDLDAASVVASAAQVTAAVASFNQQYLGEAAADPTGTKAGQLYFNTATKQMRVYTGSVWQVTYNPGTGFVDSFNGRTGAVIPALGDYSIAQITGAATVASTGAYSDLTGKPTLATVATSGLYSDLSGKPTLATVATTGVYSDLSGRPSLGTAAALNVGTSANNVIQLDASAKYPAADGSQITNLNVVAKDNGYNAVGSFAWCYINSATVVTSGATFAGSTLFACDLDNTGAVEHSGTAMSGTWRCMGATGVATNSYNIWQRIA